MQVIKRDCTEVDFDKAKIYNAIIKSMKRPIKNIDGAKYVKSKFDLEIISWSLTGWINGLSQLPATRQSFISPVLRVPSQVKSIGSSAF